jgi:very-short-patch-repair endonuclease
MSEGLQFRRQMALAAYILDFYRTAARLVAVFIPHTLHIQHV